MALAISTAVVRAVGIWYRARVGNGPAEPGESNHGQEGVPTRAVHYPSRRNQRSASRLFWVVTLGLIGVPLLTFFATATSQLIWLLMPYSILVLIIKFLAEQNGMMRAGRYIPEHIETQIDFRPGWEAWLESQPDYRLMEKHFLASFILVFFLYYFVSIGMAMRFLWGEAGQDPSGGLWYWAYGGVAAYAIGTIWGISTLVHHWKSSTTTSIEST